MQAEIYTKDMCPYCVKAKELLRELNIDYVEYKISAGLDESTLEKNQFYVTKADLLEKLPTARTVPQIWIDGEHVGGFDNLCAMHASGQLDKLMGKISLPIK